MSRFVVHHDHAYGGMFYLIEAEPNPLWPHGTPTVRQVCRSLGIDFEPSKGESLHIEKMPKEVETLLDFQESDLEPFEEPDEFENEADEGED